MPGQATVADGNIPPAACDGPIARGFDAKNLSLPLDWAAVGDEGGGVAGGRIFKGAPANMTRWLAEEALTFNYHSGGVTPASFAAHGSLGVDFRVTSTSVDRQGTAFVSTMEGRNASRPFYGVQWHPEKVLFERGARGTDGAPYEAINHGAHAVEVSRWVANFFVREARKSAHAFADAGAAMAASIYNLAAVGVQRE